MRLYQIFTRKDFENVQDKILSCLHHLAEQIQEKHLLIRVLKNISSSQQTFTCSKSTIETLQKSVKYVQS